MFFTRWINERKWATFYSRVYHLGYITDRLLTPLPEGISAPGRSGWGCFSWTLGCAGKALSGADEIWGCFCPWLLPSTNDGFVQTMVLPSEIWIYELDGIEFTTWRKFFCIIFHSNKIRLERSKIVWRSDMRIQLGIKHNKFGFYGLSNWKRYHCETGIPSSFKVS